MVIVVTCGTWKLKLRCVSIFRALRHILLISSAALCESAWRVLKHFGMSLGTLPIPL